MLKQLTSAQLTELEAMWTLEGGWGDWKQDYRIGQLTTLMAELNRDRKKRPKPFSVEEFSLRPRLEQKKRDKNKTKRLRATFDMMARPKKDKK